jgi:lysine decarboxylase
LDSARETMEKKGKKKIEHILMIAKRLSDDISLIDGFSVVSTNYLKEKYPSIYDRDETKVIVDVAKAGFNGYEVANILESKYKIIVEAYNIKTILILVPFRATLNDVRSTVVALREIAQRQKKRKKATEFNFKTPTNIPRILELNEVTKLLWSQIEKIPLTQAIGRIAAEYITPFPPGIPITIKGEEFTKEIVEYYLKLKTYPNVHIAARDKSMKSVWVVK